MQYGFGFFKQHSQQLIKYSLCLVLCYTTPFVYSQTSSDQQNPASAQSTLPNPTASDATQNHSSQQPIATSVSPATPKPNAPDPKDQLIKTSLSLLLVLILLLGLLWFMKRMGFGAGRRMGGFYRIVATSALGPKDKLVLIEIGDTWLLLGITSSSINTLHTMPAGSIDLDAEQKNPAEQFAKLLNRFNVSGKNVATSKNPTDPISPKEQV